MHINIYGEQNSLFLKIMQFLLRENFKCDLYYPPQLPVSKGVTIVIDDKNCPEIALLLKELQKDGHSVLYLHNVQIAYVDNLVFHVPISTPNKLLLMALKWIRQILEPHAFQILSEQKQREINTLLEEQTASLRIALEELDDKKQRMVEDLALASEVQKSFLPKSFPKSIPIDFTHKYIPHEYIGGDFFEIITIDDKHTGIIIADVSGHGVASALITAMFKSVFNHTAEHSFSPSEVLSKINTEFINTIRTEHYITAFYIIINTETFTATFSNAGHPVQLLVRQGGTIDTLKAQGFFIGMFEETVYENQKVYIAPGDRLILFTDGIIECQNTDAQSFGRQNLLQLLNDNRNMDIENLSKTIVSEVVAYMAENRFPDDVTLLIAERLPEL
ncbi:MAG: serine/threonine-protein phosphatase [Spirochaetales bacterium]|nr:serine/threonine-protein phosphatase [Spirochaetales bacterium]